MRAQVTVTVELVAEDGPRRDRVLSSVTVTRERLVPVVPANAAAIHSAADAAADSAVAAALSGTLSTLPLETRA